MNGPKAQKPIRQSIWPFIRAAQPFQYWDRETPLQSLYLRPARTTSVTQASRSSILPFGKPKAGLLPRLIAHDRFLQPHVCRSPVCLPQCCRYRAAAPNQIVPNFSTLNKPCLWRSFSHPYLSGATHAIFRFEQSTHIKSYGNAAQ